MGQSGAGHAHEAVCAPKRFPDRPARAGGRIRPPRSAQPRGRTVRAEWACGGRGLRPGAPEPGAKAFQRSGQPAVQIPQSAFVVLDKIAQMGAAFLQDGMPLRLQPFLLLLDAAGIPGR